MAREDKRRNSRYARSQTLETAEYSCSSELEPRSFLIVYADIRHNVGGWGLYDCVHVGNCPVVDWETGNCALGGWGLWLCIGSLGIGSCMTVHVAGV